MVTRQIERQETFRGALPATASITPVDSRVGSRIDPSSVSGAPAMPVPALPGNARVISTRAFSYPQSGPGNPACGTPHAEGGATRQPQAASAVRVRSHDGDRTRVEGFGPAPGAGNPHAAMASAAAGLQ